MTETEKAGGDGFIPASDPRFDGEPDEERGWLCWCGNWQPDGWHCSACHREPPWGCDCSECQERRCDPEPGEEWDFDWERP